MIECFTDPVLRAPTLGSLFLCMSLAVIGVIVFLRKESLIAETLSHAAYPGACLGTMAALFFFPSSDAWLFLLPLTGAFLTSSLGLSFLHRMEKKQKVRPDTSLCFVLAVFFGFGLLLASAAQSRLSQWTGQVQTLLFGQPATMQDMHIWMYAGLCVATFLFVYLSYYPLKAVLFNREFARFLRVPVRPLERLFFALLVLALVAGMRCVGALLISSMVIAPPVAARGFSNRLSVIYFLSALFGALSAAIGSYLSKETALPTGPAVVLVATAFALFSLLFSPERGLIFKAFRIARFRLRCLEENLLKSIWKRGVFLEERTLLVRFALYRLRKAGYLNASFALTSDGMKKSAGIVRLHRLWELYLTQSLGVSAEAVHKTAEQMEHILTPEMEKRLTHLLENPKADPHNQPIPETQ